MPCGPSRTWPTRVLATAWSPLRPRGSASARRSRSPRRASPSHPRARAMCSAAWPPPPVSSSDLRTGSAAPSPLPPGRERAAGAPADERALLDRALTEARTAIEHDRTLVHGRAGAADAAIFDAHLALLDDDALLEPTETAIGSGAPAERAWYDAAQEVAAR